MARATRVAQVDIIHRLADAETIWRGMEKRRPPVYALSARFDFLSAWRMLVRTAGARSSLSSSSLPILMAIRWHCCRSEPATRMACAPRVSSGGEHADIQHAAADRGFRGDRQQGRDRNPARTAAHASAQGSRPARRWRASPRTWQGIVNPLSLLPAQASVNGCPLLKLSRARYPTRTTISNSFRRRLKSKERSWSRCPAFVM